MLKSKHKLHVQIPQSVVRGEYCKLSGKAFVVYAYMLHKQFKGHSEYDDIQIDHKSLQAVLRITDNRTFKKCLNELYVKELLKNEVKKLPNNRYLHVELKKIDDKYFTQIPVSLFHRIDEIGHVGFQLLCYYESFINRKQLKREFAFPAFETIKNDLKISNDTISKYNDKLIAAEMLTITKHLVKYEDSLELDRFIKWQNHYFILLHNI